MELASPSGCDLPTTPHLPTLPSLPLLPKSLMSSLRCALAASAAEAPAFAAGDSVLVTFDGRRHPGTVTAILLDGVRFRVQFDDDVVDDIAAHEMKRVGDILEANLRGGDIGLEAPEAAIEPSHEQLCALPAELPPLPPESIEADFHPNGLLHCGGDLSFPNLTLAHPALQHRMPLFLMGPGAVASFAGAKLCHGTTAHHAAGSRLDGCRAHVSFAVQTPAAALKVDTKDAARGKLYDELVAAGSVDANSPAWQEPNAVWLPVWHFEGVKAPSGKLWHDANTMCALPWRRIVLYDVEASSAVERIPLVFYDMDGGLPTAAAAAAGAGAAAAGTSAAAASTPDGADAGYARKHFEFLHDGWRFHLDRHAHENGTSGCLHLDRRGEQRMEMLGVRSQRRNAKQVPAHVHTHVPPCTCARARACACSPCAS